MEADEFPSTVEPRLTNTLVKRTPLLNEQFWPVPNIFSVNSCLKTSPWANNLAIPVQRTILCLPNLSAHGVLARLNTGHCHSMQTADWNCQTVKHSLDIRYDMRSCLHINWEWENRHASTHENLGERTDPTWPNSQTWSHGCSLKGGSTVMRLVMWIPGSRENWHKLKNSMKNKGTLQRGMF